MQFAQGFIEHPSADLGKPIVKRSKKTEHDSAHDDVVKVRDDKVRTGELPIERRRALHDAGETGYQDLEQERDAKQHRCLELDFPTPHRAEPVENLNASWNSDNHRRHNVEAVGIETHSDNKNEVRPQTHAHKVNPHRGFYHDRVAKNRLER